MMYDDPMLDHIIAEKTMSITQQDVFIESNKKAKNFPLLTRQIPFYVIVFPTNRQSRVFTGAKSKITDFGERGSVTREIEYVPSLDPKQTDPRDKEFKTYTIDANHTNVYGNYDPQARNIQINYLTNREFKEGYSTSGKVGVGADQPSRQPTTLRTMNNIVNELVTNYSLFENRVGHPEINTFDLMSRLTLTEFNKFAYLENAGYLMPRIRKGILKNVKVVSPIKNQGITYTKKTRIKNRKEGIAAGDIYFPIKPTTIGQYVIPPATTEEWGGSFGNIDQANNVGITDAVELRPDPLAPI